MQAATALNADDRVERELPDYLPARNVSEFAYCPRLFYYEQVAGVFVHNEYTAEGAAQHKRVDKESKGAPAPDEPTEEPVVARSITLSSDQYRLIAKLDLTEFSGGRAVPVEYKRGRPMRTDSGLGAWPSDRVQLAIQAIVLRDNGYKCDAGLVFYRQTRQRVRLRFDDSLIEEAEQAIEGAWATAASKVIPPPLVDSPKCPGCSLVGVCLPDETVHLIDQPASEPVAQYALFDEEQPAIRKGPGTETRLLVAPRVDSRPLYVNTQGLRVGKSGSVLRIKEQAKLVQEARINEICQVNLMGNIQITTQAVQGLCQSGVPICYFSQGGWFYGVTTGMNTKNVMLRRSQFVLADQQWFCLRLARSLVGGKIRNQRTMLLRNHIEPSPVDLRTMKRLVMEAENADSFEELLGLEGYGARIYFSQFPGMVKRDEEHGPGEAELNFHFGARNRRPPRDPINALLSYGYSLLAKDFTVACYAVGFDPMVGFFHQPRHGRPALSLDLMEPFRPLIVDSALLSAVNTRMVTAKDFVTAGKAVSMTANGRKGFLRAYEARMDTLVTHPLFDYRVSYRRLLEIQARLLGKVIEGELSEYPVFITR